MKAVAPDIAPSSLMACNLYCTPTALLSAMSNSASMTLAPSVSKRWVIRLM